ncbi:MAG: reverse transcriptase domain-containing protein, partial [Candidatus Fonsibacter sp.]
MGYLFGICVEKNAELDPSLRKFKGRVVFQGNQVYDQDHNYAIFQDLGSSPSTLQAAKAVDFYGCLPGHCIEVADAEQAYIQADMQGDPTWVCLPPEARPDWWKKSFPHLRRPVCLMKKALYGHPDAGTYWEKKCDAHVKSVGFVPIGPEWPSCYYHAKLSLMLSVYVDDFKLAGPKNNILAGWKTLREGLHIEPEQRVDDKGAVYLGCRHIISSLKLASGHVVTTMTYDMED